MKRLRGFSLVELMVAIAILAILASVAVPAFRELLVANRLASTTNELVSALNIARSEAIRRGNWVNVDANGNWSNGWTVYVDADESGTLNAGDVVLREAGPVLANIAGFTVLGTAQVQTGVSYRPDGTARRIADNQFQIGAIRTCYPTGQPNNARNVRIAAGGRIALDRETVPNCAAAP